MRHKQIDREALKMAKGLLRHTIAHNKRMKIRKKTEVSSIFTNHICMCKQAALNRI